MLTEEEIHMLLDLLKQEVVVKPSEKFPYTITKEVFGYSSDRNICALQSTLSIMLAVARQR